IRNMDEWFIQKDPDMNRKNALEWRHCNSDVARKDFVKENEVRWSELYRISYFNPIQHVIVDLMHCLFLEIAKWIVKRIWIDKGILTPNILDKIQEMIEKFQIPADIGRIPGKINCGEGFSNFTADK